MRHTLRVIFLAVATAVVALSAIAWLHGYPLRFMDLDDYGSVSPREMVRSLDLGLRPVDVDGKPCTEIFQLKDSLPQRVVCEE